MDDKKDLLLRLGSGLYQLGIKAETARRKLKRLTEDGGTYESEEVLAALHELQILNSQWKSLEKQYLELQKEMIYTELEREKNESAADLLSCL